MAGVTIEFAFQDREFTKALGRLASVGKNPAGLLRAIGVGLQHTTQQRFERGQAPDGTAWAPLRPAYAAIKRGPGILREAGMRGGLQGSITFATEGRSVLVGSNKVYAAVHQFGAVIVPKGKKFLVFRLAGGLVRAKKVTIPARPYLGFGPEDEHVVMDALHVLLPGG